MLETGTVAVLANQQLAEAHQIRYPDSDAASLTHLRPDKDRSDHLTHYYRWPGEMHLSLRLLNPEFLALWDADQKLLELLTAPAKSSGQRSTSRKSSPTFVQAWRKPLN